MGSGGPPAPLGHQVGGTERLPAGGGERGCERGMAWDGSGDPGLAAGVGGRELDRAIRTGKLRVSPRFDSRPIDVMVSHGSRRDLVSRGVSRLDAFSGYPVQT
jgi:hypothetical protein